MPAQNPNGSFDATIRPQTQDGSDRDYLAEFTRRDAELRRREQALQDRPQQDPRIEKLMGAVQALTSQLGLIQSQMGFSSFQQDMPREKFPLLAKSKSGRSLIQGLIAQYHQAGLPVPSPEELAQKAEDFLATMRDELGVTQTQAPDPKTAQPEASSAPAPAKADSPKTSPASIPMPGGPLAGPAAASIEGRAPMDLLSEDAIQAEYAAALAEG